MGDRVSGETMTVAVDLEKTKAVALSISSLDSISIQLSRAASRVAYPGIAMARGTEVEFFSWKSECGVMSLMLVLLPLALAPKSSKTLSLGK